MKILHDAHSRKSILDLSSSFVVRAPAGSGKTETLLARYLSTLLEVEQPESCVVLTFTHKAVAELKERLQGFFNGSRQPSELIQPILDRVKQRSIEKNWFLQENQYRMSIMTIDSYYLKLYEHFSHEPAHLGLELSLAPKNLAEQLVEAFLKKTLLQETDLQVLKLAQGLDHNFSWMHSLLCGCYLARETWLPLLNAQMVPQDHTEHPFSHEMNNLCEILRSHHTDLHDLFTFIGQYHQNYAQIQINRLSVAHIKLLAPLVLTQKGQWRKVFRSDSFMPSVDQLHPWHDESDRKAMIQILQGIIATLNQTPNLALVIQLMLKWPDDLTLLEHQQNFLDVLKKLLHFGVSYKLTAGLRDFSDVTFGLWSLLKNPVSVDLFSPYLEQHLDHLFIDESQDLSFIQCAIFECIISMMRYSHRTFFFVGDPQQAIYHFRGAQVGIFQYLEDLQIEGIKKFNVCLYTNFRSCPEIVEMINKFGEHAFGKVSYPILGIDKALASKASREESGQVVTNSYTDAEQEASQILLSIKKVMEKSPDHTFGILARDRKTLRPFVRAARQIGLVVHSPELNRLIDQPWILDTLAFAKVFLAPDCKKHWIDFMRSCFMHTSYEDIQCIYGLDIQGFWECTEEQLFLFSNEFSHSYKKLQRLFQQIESYKFRIPVHLWMKRAVSIFGFEQYLEEQEREEWDLFFDYLKDASWAEPVDWDRIEEELTYTYSKVSRSSNINLFTIHRSKGLEFDHVYLPDLGSRLPSSEALMMTWVHWEGKLLLGVSPPLGEEDSTYEFCKSVHYLHQQQEAKRVLYVALTRARHTLNLSWNQQIHQRSFWSFLEEIVQEAPLTSDIYLIQPLRRLQHKVPISHASYSINMKNVMFNADPLPMMFTKYDSLLHRIIGLVLHDILKITELFPLPSTMVSKNHLLGLYRKYGGDSSQAASFLNQIGVILAKLQQSVIAAEIFCASHLNVLKEWGCLYTSGKRMRSLVIDRVVQKSNGEWILYEFKTIQFAYVSQEQLTLYNDQVKLYKDALSVYFQKPVQAYLYFMGDDKILRVE